MEVRLSNRTCIHLPLRHEVGGEGGDEVALSFPPGDGLDEMKDSITASHFETPCLDGDSPLNVNSPCITVCPFTAALTCA